VASAYERLVRGLEGEMGRLGLGVRIGVVWLAYLLLAAHFMRSGTFPMVLMAMGFPALLFLRRTAARVAVQVGLLFCAGVWLLTALTLATARLRMGQPWLRMALILGAVAALSVVAGVLLQLGGMRRWTAGRAQGASEPRAVDVPHQEAAPGEAAGSPEGQGTKMPPTVA
jgi:hypothetical protein